MHIDNKTQGLDVATITAEDKYSFDFPKSGKRFVLSLQCNGSKSVFSDIPGKFVVFVELLLYYIYHHITCDTTGKVAREVGEIGP